MSHHVVGFCSPCCVEATGIDLCGCVINSLKVHISGTTDCSESFVDPGTFPHDCLQEKFSIDGTYSLHWDEDLGQWFLSFGDPDGDCSCDDHGPDVGKLTCIADPAQPLDPGVDRVQVQGSWLCSVAGSIACDLNEDGSIHVSGTITFNVVNYELQGTDAGGDTPRCTMLTGFSRSANFEGDVSGCDGSVPMGSYENGVFGCDGDVQNNSVGFTAV